MSRQLAGLRGSDIVMAPGDFMAITLIREMLLQMSSMDSGIWGPLKTM